MKRIQSLTSTLIDQIAAGEVVERPAHLVKELVENSLDAGATEITIEYSNGGREVTVSDNGAGIHPEDVKKALDRHATSKIISTDDLWKLNTFGFRGEALASIAAVSELSLSSKILNEANGIRVVSQYGKIGESQLVGHTQGTRVQIGALFENVPARLKFMKSDAAESSQIKSVVKALALSHPQATFRVTQESELVYLWPKVESKLERAIQVLDVPLYEGSAIRDQVQAYAVFADPHHTTRSSKNIWLFAQGRWIQDRALQAAVLEAYRNLLMHGEYPICAIWVNLPPDQIDVNVHPTKSQVKFLDPSLAFRAVQASLREALEKTPWLPRTGNEKNYSDQVFSGQEFQQNQCEMNQKNQQVQQNQQEPTFQNLKFSDSIIERTQFAQKMQAARPAQVKEANNSSVPSIQEILLLKVSESHISSHSYWSNLQVLSQANQTYIICQSSEGLVIVDQHAAHERVMFEKLMHSWKSGTLLEVQDFLFPIVMDLTTEKMEYFDRVASELQKFGIFIEQMGPLSLGIKSAPSLLKDSSISKAIEKMFDEIFENGDSFQMEKILSGICSTLACHSAIRAGQTLSLQEMQALLVSMDEFSMSSFCPHGRPVSIKYNFRELEKDFGRIV